MCHGHTQRSEDKLRHQASPILFKTASAVSSPLARQAPGAFPILSQTPWVQMLTLHGWLRSSHFHDKHFHLLSCIPRKTGTSESITHLVSDLRQEGPRIRQIRQNIKKTPNTLSASGCSSLNPSPKYLSYVSSKDKLYSPSSFFIGQNHISMKIR